MCNCTKNKPATGTTYTVKYANNTTYKVYSSKLEADAAALRVGGKVVQS